MSSRLYGSSPTTAAQMTLDMHRTQGAVIIANTAVVTGNFSEIVATSATVIASLVSERPGAVQNNTSRTSNTATAVVLPVTGSIRGRFTSITLTSGSVIAYNSP